MRIPMGPAHRVRRVKLIGKAGTTPLLTGGLFCVEAAGIESAAPRMRYFFFVVAHGTGKPRLRISALMPGSLPRNAR